MSFLSKLLDRRRGSASAHVPADVGDTIARALSAAGLDRGTSGSIRETIDSALAGAGIKAAVRPVVDSAEGASPARPAGGRFLEKHWTGPAGARDYRLYLPAGYDASGPARPLLVMLHGCTQSAEDFAVGTGMNALADRHGLLVAYPSQTGEANQARCWNWFRPGDQRAEGGEPAMLAGIVRQVAGEYRVDGARVFVAGLSAGAAMAVVLGHEYPDLVRAVGVHSGLPYASAHDVPSAFAAMQGRGTAPAAGAPRVPMIVFHGDRDRTVALSNADALARAAMPDGAAAVVETGQVAGGHAWSREVVRDGAGLARLERWTVHGAGHAWSGGDAAGSYTDPRGPDASEAMVRFFLDVAAERAPTA